MNEEFELMYVYIDDIGRTFEKQGICFTNDFLISYRNRKLTLEKIYNPYRYIWGENITSINLLIGKNGSGKTTLLELLGSERRKRINYESFSKLSWFALYRKGKDKFIIEGNGIDLITNMEIERDAIEEYGFTFSYDYDKSYFHNMNLVKEVSNELTYLYYPDTTMYSWCNEKTKYDNDNTAFSFSRNTLHVSNYDNIYAFICKEIEFLNTYGEKEKVLNIPNIKCKIGLKTELGAADIEISDRVKKYTPKEKFILYLISIIIRSISANERINYFEGEYEKEKKNLIKRYIDSNSTTKEEIEDFNMIINLAENLNEVYFNTKNKYDGFPQYSKRDAWLSIDMKGEYDNNVYEFLKKIISKPYLLSYFYIKFDDLSVGEMEFINLFSNLYYGIEKSIINNNKNIILLLDEPGKGFHPEWARRFINYLYNLSNYLGEKYGCKFQYLITTHSPFMISDIPKNNIKRFLNKDERKGICKIEKSTKGLMSNIHDIIKDDFYVQSPIGCFAENLFIKLQEDIDKIENIEEDQEKIKNIQYIIDDIDEIILSSKLNEILQEHIDRLVYSNKNQKRYRIKQLEMELEKLRGSKEKDI